MFRAKVQRSKGAKVEMLLSELGFIGFKVYRIRIFYEYKGIPWGCGFESE
jgi:hypothetical protein